MTPNEIVHKAMGLCWHGTFLPKRLYGAALYCEHCGVYIDHCELNPDYSQPEQIGKVYAWIDWRKLAKHLSLNVFNDCTVESVFKLIGFLEMENAEQIKLIAEWITDEEKS